MSMIIIDSSNEWLKTNIQIPRLKTRKNRCRISRLSLYKFKNNIVN